MLVAGALETSDAPAAFLREVRRIVAPAGTVVLVVPRFRLSLNPLLGQHYSRARLDRLLVEAMFEPLDWATFGGVYLVRARPRGGAALAPAGGGRRVAGMVRA